MRRHLVIVTITANLIRDHVAAGASIGDGSTASPVGRWGCPCRSPPAADPAGLQVQRQDGVGRSAEDPNRIKRVVEESRSESTNAQVTAAGVAKVRVLIGERMRRKATYSRRLTPVQCGGKEDEARKGGVGRNFKSRRGRRAGRGTL